MDSRDASPGSIELNRRRFLSAACGQLLFSASCSESSMSKANVLVHDGPSGILEKTYEYLLPFDGSALRAEHRSLLTPWFARFMEMDTTQIRAKLAAEWQALSHPDLTSLRDHMLSRSPRSIVVHEDRVWLCTEAPGSGLIPLLMREPRTLNEEQLRFVNGFDLPALAPMCSHFFDVQEEIGPYNNSWRMRPQPTSVARFPGIGKWQEGLELYYVCSGDMIVLSTTGRIGRWGHHVSAVGECASSFEDLIDQYVAYLEMPRDRRKTTIFW